MIIIFVKTIEAELQSMTAATEQRQHELQADRRLLEAKFRIHQAEVRTKRVREQLAHDDRDVLKHQFESVLQHATATDSARRLRDVNTEAQTVWVLVFKNGKLLLF
jgi:hypothetical protein